MNLDLSAVDNAPKIVTCVIEGIVEVEDIHELLHGGAVGPSQQAQHAAAVIADDPSDMSRVREKWHSVARLLAGGMPQSIVATISGYSPAYLSVLLNNPAMQEMVELYRATHGAAAMVVAEKLRTVGGKALDALSDKLDAGTIQDVHELTAVAKLGFDRSGHGPSSTQHVVSEQHLVDHARLAELNSSARTASRERILPLAARRIEHKTAEGDECASG